MSWLHQQKNSFNCTPKPDDVTCSYKFRSLKHFLSRGKFNPLNERVSNMRPVKQYHSDSSMTNEVHDTNLIRLVFLGLKK